MRRRVALYVFSGLVVASILLAFYFFLKKPQIIEPPKLLEGEKRVFVFRDVKYSGEKGGAADWEITADLARKYMDTPIVEMENVKGSYKPKPGTLVSFSGSKSSLDTETEKGRVDNIEIIYNNEYRMKSPLLNFDFKAGLASTNFPVEIKSAKLTLRGTGLTARAKDELLRIERNVNGSVETGKGGLRFEADRLTYRLKENLYELEGRVRMTGEQLTVTCDTLYLYGRENELERLEAKGKVRLVSKRVTARGENAVYYFKEDGAAAGQPARPSLKPKEMKQLVR
jgi:lipopolysaccharide export system protein LptA